MRFVGMMRAVEGRWEVLEGLEGDFDSLWLTVFLKGDTLKYAEIASQECRNLFSWMTNSIENRMSFVQTLSNQQFPIPF
jgi:hypothetical protein